MANKPAITIANQVALLKQRGMLFKDEPEAFHLLENISYYRLKGYWWDLQEDYSSHIMKPNTFFEDVVARYNFDRQLRLILFDAIECIEVALRTKMIYHLSLSKGSLWYLDANLFEKSTIQLHDGTTRAIYQNTIDELKKEFNRSQEIFIKDQRKRYPQADADSWKIMEVASLGTLSKLYKILNHQLPEKALIASEMGFHLHNELSSWLEAITYVRNIIAHHSRLWSRTMVKRPIANLNNPMGDWFVNQPNDVQTKKPFLIISCMVYLCDRISPGNVIKNNILELFDSNPNIPIYKLGFLNNWNHQPLWQ